MPDEIRADLFAQLSAFVCITNCCKLAYRHARLGIPELAVKEFEPGQTRCYVRASTTQSSRLTSSKI
jgi:hypothetical protein